MDSKVKVAKKPAAAKPAKPSIFARLGQYFRDVRSEMKRIVWPSKSEVWNAWRVVVVTLVVFAALIFLLDNVLVAIISQIAKLKVGG